MPQTPCEINLCQTELNMTRMFGKKSSQKTLIEQLEKEKIHGKYLEDKVEIAENKIRELENVMKMALRANKILNEISVQDKRKITELDEVCTELTKDLFIAIQNKNSIFKKMSDLMQINEGLSGEINLNHMMKKMKDLNDEDKRMLRS